MRTNIALDDALVSATLKLTGACTKREVVHLALQEPSSDGSARSFSICLDGLQFEEGFDYKALGELGGGRR